MGGCCIDDLLLHAECVEELHHLVEVGAETYEVEDGGGHEDVHDDTQELPAEDDGDGDCFDILEPGDLVIEMVSGCEDIQAPTSRVVERTSYLVRERGPRYLQGGQEGVH